MTSQQPAWLTHLVDQRLALLNQKLPPSNAFGYDIVVMPIKEIPDGVDLEKWERTCDHCGKYCSDDERFYTAHAVFELKSKIPAVFIVGVCESCKWADPSD